MDGISLFSYFPGTSILHRFDPRLKTASVIGLSVTVFLSESTGLVLLTILMSALLFLSGYPLLKRQNLRQLRGIVILSLLVFMGRALFSGAGGSGDAGASESTPLIEGAKGAWRLLLFAAAGLIFTVTTSTIRIQDGIISILRPLPFVPEQKIAVMMSLTITFVPFIFTVAREVLDVHRSRGINLKKRPFRGTYLFTSHVLAAILQYTDDVSTAMEARAYGGLRTKPRFTPGLRDAVMTLIIAACIAGALLTDRRVPLF
jgi:energy-coupling factor transporter transmembrane protein EcfT